MRHLRHIVLIGLAVALCAPASAHGASRVGHLVPPHARVDGLNGGEAMGQSWARLYSLPTAENPAAGNGAPCVRLGRTGSILVGVDFQPVPCTVGVGTTVLVWGVTSTCSNVEEPPFFAEGRAAQRRCARTGLVPYVNSVSLSVDGGVPVDLQKPRFAIFSPQINVQVPADHPFAGPPGPGNFTAWGWVAWLKDLPLGQHTVRTETEWTDGSEPHVISLVINVAATATARDDD